MRLSHLDKTPLGSPRSRRNSPNIYAQRNSSNVSVHSQHLWNLMEDAQLFPEEVFQLLKYEQGNLGSFKKGIQREKLKVAQQFQNLKREVVHNIDDLKVSMFAELDRIYRFYMEKYAILKSQIMEIKRLKDEIQNSVGSRNANFTSRLSPHRDTESNKFTAANNASIMKSIEKNNLEAKKYQMLNYIAELQREKIMPLHQLSNHLVLLTQYQNGFYQHKEFQGVCTVLIQAVKANLRSIYEKKYEFLRQPERICQNQQQPMLDQLYQPPVPTHNPYPNPSNANNLVARAVGNQLRNHHQDNIALNQNLPPSLVTKLEDARPIAVANDGHSVAFKAAENVILASAQCIKSVAEDIILCALEINRNSMAVGSKDGIITIYDINSGQKTANLRGHKASICKLAMVNNNGKRYLASGSDRGCSSIVLWDTNGWNMRMKIECHKAAVTAILDLEDNRALISGSYDKTINVYNLQNEGQILFNLPANSTSVTAVLMNCSGNKLVTCGLDDSIYIYQIVRGAGRQVQTMFMEREIQNNTMICSIVASIVQADLVFLGTKDGKIKLLNIDRGDAYQTYGVCSNAVIQMIVVERQSKPQFPIAICWPCSEQNLKIVNTQTGKINTQATKGFIEFGCGIGPKSFFLSSGRNIVMLSQSKQWKEIQIFRVQTSN